MNNASPAKPGSLKLRRTIPLRDPVIITIFKKVIDDSKMQVMTALRRFCTLSSQGSPLINSDYLAAPLRGEARRVASAVRRAREATAIAAAEGSDDVERREAFLKVKQALRIYSQLAAHGDPPVQLTEHGKPIEDSEHLENDVTRLFDDDVQAMKQEVFESNRQRVWIGWRDWF